MGKKIILFELNEVPFRIIDCFCQWRPQSNFARLLPQCYRYETYSEDKSDLSPWKTWPTVHRGVNDEQHLIYDFGQDLNDVDDEYPTIWRILAANGVSTGVCGSLHSYPMPEDLSGYSFYLPDTFAAGSECFPKKLSIFQEFNLRMARDSARNVSTKVPWASALRFLANAPGLGLKMNTFVDITGQVVSERLKQWKKIRRRTYQTVLAFDVYMRQLEDTRPAFSTFFTNHVASSMHRYWAATFPADYAKFGYDNEWVETYRNEIDFTMSKFDAFFARLVKFVDASPEYVLWVATSMGQAATEAMPLETQLYITDLPKFMEQMGVASTEWSRMPAMLPQYNIHIAEHKRADFRSALNTIIVDGQALGWREAANGFFSLDFGHHNLYLNNTPPMFRGQSVSYESLGLSNVKIEDKSGASAYHIPQGSLVVYDPNDRAPKEGRPMVSTLEIAPTLLANFGVKRPGYMRPAVTIGPSNGSA
jgi:hypothetical protein